MRLPARSSIVLATTLAALSGAVAPAGAAIPDAQVIDGPSAAISGLDGVAMAPDGTGGLVYRKRVDDHDHVFVARFVGGTWQPPQRVDVGQQFNSFTPAIAAGNNGRLVVVWIHQYGADLQDRLYSASLDPGATRFQAPIPIDLDVRDGQDVDPRIAMTAGGTAYLVYRVVYSRQDPNLPPGYVDADIRAQRYSGSFWSALGNPLDRNVTQAMQAPTADNGPQVAVDVNGNAVAAWLEPDDDLVPRVYARRLFGLTPGFIKQVSASTIAGKAVRGAVDQFSLATSPFGEGAIAFRQLAAPQDPFTRPRAFVNLIPNVLTDKAADFVGQQAIDLGGADGPDATLGPVSVAVGDSGAFVAGLGANATSSLVTGTETTVDPTAQRLDDGGSTVPGNPVVTRSGDGALAAAWQIDTGGSAGVGIREVRADGTPFTQLVSSPTGGRVSGLELSGSGLGDAAIAFVQGTDAQTQIVGASVNAPPEVFTVATPPDWVRTRRNAFTWDSAPNAIGKVVYTLQVDGEDLASGLAGTAFTTKADAIDDGRHEVTVVARDSAGQETTSDESLLLVDRSAPRAKAKVARRTRTVTVTVSDGAKAESSGVAAGTTTVRWGDGKRSTGTRTLRHRFRKGGRVTLRVTTRDRIGNTRTTTLKVKL